MFKKSVALSLAVMLLLGSFLMVAAQSQGQTSTSILVQNLSASDATLRVDFYNTGGTNTNSIDVAALCGECSSTFDQRYGSGDPGEDPFQGAAIVSSDQPIGAVVQEVRTGGSAGVNSYDSYNGLPMAAQEIEAPLILRGVNSAGKVWNTVMSIQNVNVSASANVTVTFSPAGLGNSDVQNFTIPAGGTWYLDQATQTGLGTQFFGAATVESDQDVAVVVNSGTNDGAGLIVYPTYTSGSSDVYLPGAMKNISSLGDSYFTSFTVVNMGTSPVTVTVDYQPLSGTTDPPYEMVVDNVATVDLRTDPNITSDTFFGAIQLTTSGGSIAAMLNERGDDEGTGAMSYATTYGGFPSGVQTAYMPYLLKYINSAGYSWSTSILIQNLTASPIDVTITYTEDPSFGTDSFTSVVTVDEFESVDLRFDPNLTEGTFYGSAKLEGTGAFGAVTLVRGSNGTGDALSSYLNITP